MGLKLTEDQVNVKTVTHCPRCGAMGTVIDQRKKFISVQCPVCRFKWETYSKICPQCHKPNGFAIAGKCGSCYGQQH